ncbi:MAG: RdgB/HAM1 family non-canonical purine NTP pyrophosphatase [Gammaproteobacteria bacterium]|nr:RdgB/HAM1 family non-canonical purine NTP pyrophosphatase [Gammaproteobacteria bacterium]NNJ72869.1 RdgB/HAM1 family non-canonical purine NTP pyrophosphatase [Enterobacterales bacterium]
MSSIILASGNPGKLREFKQLFKDLPYLVEPQSTYDVPDVPETGTTFIENAIIKARHAAVITGKPCIADDSGIEVDALSGEPGIYSARFAGIGASNEANLNKLLDVTKEIPSEQLSCRYVCVLVLMRHAKDPTPLISQATWEGTLLREPVGENGFGYDPIFWLEEYGCSSAQLAPELKDQISHRGKALRDLVTQLQNLPHLIK